ncbi:dTDP-4-dehydrorhamnose 3,5-epimerase [Neorhizobium lilium]|uniref:dTDP-4-dehydrorhamnose 3,5-epimerase n=1 Tax=Neorhizobium lilium TaxID=2503024 RepID=A0A444LKQ6_9HYPH|nr:dTDP-4-dehydrorhamnose 3,5-epimerase [Neorhizobium lilium]RWX80906.1 dTDP-4-dehydrorhamnose 3,5-epimerase [Neorhizobium lilium]
MRFSETEIDQLWIIEPERFVDLRGSFARTFCKQEFYSQGLVTEFPQHSISMSTMKHTLRGLHFQKAPHQEAKVVSCVRGAIWDVVVDLRTESPTYLHWVAALLTAENGKQFYIPENCAHGFQSMTDDVAVSYLISAPYAPGSAHGMRYDDPAVGIEWPAIPSVISDRDLAWPAWQDAAALPFAET